MLRETAVELLRSMGHAVVAAESGPRALEELARSGPFDLLFTDLVMPGGMTGIELASEARRRYPALRVLATSGYASVNVLHGDARELPVLLSKPYSEFALASHIAQVFAEEAE